MYKKPKKQVKAQVKPQIVKPQNRNNLDYFYNDLLKNSIDLNEKMANLDKREQQLKKIAENAKKTMKLVDIKKVLNSWYESKFDSSYFSEKEITGSSYGSMSARKGRGSFDYC